MPPGQRGAQKKAGVALLVVDAVARRRGWVCRTGSPASLVFVGVLCGTWWTLHRADPALAHQVLVGQSTNWHNMVRRPVRVLLGSPFWSEGRTFPGLFVAEFAVVSMAVERWLGTRRWLLVFAAGHVGGTLLTVGWIGYAVAHGLLGAEMRDVVDVGASYGFYALAAQLTYRLPGRRARGAWAGLLVAYLAAAALRGGTFTDYGHLTAAVIGFAVQRLFTCADDEPDLSGAAVPAGGG